MQIQDFLGKDNTLGQDIWNNKYKYKDETFDDWIARISNGDRELADLLLNKKFLFAGRILANRGLYKYGKKITYSNCYVVTPPEDNIESIFDTAKSLARTYSYGGGCGVDIGKLRPVGSKVNNAAETTSGAVSFMALYSMVTELIGQSGRRGALMISIPVNHPDLLSFVKIKADLNAVTKANISIRMSNEFMNAVKNREKFMLEFVVNDTEQVIEEEVDAYEIFKKIAEMNWDYAEPGMLFWDRIEKWNLLANTEEFEFAGTNPCAEEPLPAGGSCLLGALNLSTYVTSEKEFDFETFRSDVMVAVKSLNDVLDEGLPLHPLEEQRKAVKDWRQIGLGVLGIADLMIKLEIRYGSQESIDLCDRIGFEMANAAIAKSAILAKTDGAFPKCNIEEVMNTEFFIANTTEETKKLVSEIGGMRNSQLLTIAPTGTISTMLGISGGIEPIFSNSYTRKTESLHGEDVYYKVYTPVVEDYMQKNGILSEEELPDFFITAQEFDYIERLDLQSIWQKHIDASISSTVNVSNDFTVEQVEDLYMKAWEKGLKGVTIFRDGCKRTGILTLDDKKDEENEDELKRGQIVKASERCIGRKRALRTGCGTLHCEAFFHPETGELLEVFLSKGSTGGCNSFMVGLSRMISIAARGGVSIFNIVDQLMSTPSCSSYVVRTVTKHDTSKGACCPMAVGNALIDMHKEIQDILKENIELREYECVIQDPIESFNPKDKTNVEKDQISKQEKLKERKREEKAQNSKEEGASVKNPCPMCGAELTFEGGCNTCKSCGYSKCD